MGEPDEPMHYLLDVLEDSAEAEEGFAIAHVQLATYTVAAPSGVFKQGRLWEQGERIEVPVETGERLVAAGDLTPLEENR